MARILIVDDASIMRKNLKTILAEAGHTIIGEASNGSQAYIEYVKYKPDLVTMDITMPYMNGLDTLKKILNDYPDAKIIIISSTNNNKIILEAIQSGAKNYIIKPFMVDKVLDVVNQVLQLNNTVSSDTIDKIYKNIEASTSNNPSLDLEMEIKTIVPNNQIDNEIDLTLRVFDVHLKNDTFIIRINDNIDQLSFKTLYTAMQGFLLVKPLKIVFDFTAVKQLYSEYTKSLVEYMNKAVNLGGTVSVAAHNKDFTAALKDCKPDSSISFSLNPSVL